MPLSKDPPKPPEEITTFRLQFNGSAGQYFGIWLANLALSIITLGIYSPWAKVRRLKYFYQHTTLLGSNFDFHGDPFRILIGRIIALILFVIYSVLSGLESTWQLLAFAMLICCAPFIIQRALRFRLRSTSHRGLRFNFHGTVGGALVNAILVPIVSAIPLGVTYPLGLREWRKYQLRNSAYGGSSFSYEMGIGPFYAMCILPILPILFYLFGASIIIATSFGGLILKHGDQAPAEQFLRFQETLKSVGPVMIFVAGLTFFAVRGIYAYFKHRVVYGGLSIGGYKFKSTIPFWRTLWVVGTNDFLSAVTLGLYRPVAAIRAARLQLTNIEISGPTDVGSFIGENAASVSALGTEAIDLFDFDIGL